MVMGLKLLFRQMCLEQLYLESLRNLYVLLRKAVFSGVAERSNLKHPEGLENQRRKWTGITPIPLLGGSVSVISFLLTFC